MSSKVFSGLLCVAIAYVVCGSAAAQAPKNDLPDIKTLEKKLAALKLEQEVADALAQCRRLAMTDPARCVVILKKILAKVAADEALTRDRRERLIRMLKDKIRTYRDAVEPI